MSLGARRKVPGTARSDIEIGVLPRAEAVQAVAPCRRGYRPLPEPKDIGRALTPEQELKLPVNHDETLKIILGIFRSNAHLSRSTEPPAGLTLALAGLWWDAKGDWTRAHESAQQDEGARARGCMPTCTGRKATRTMLRIGKSGWQTRLPGATRCGVARHRESLLG